MKDNLIAAEMLQVHNVTAEINFFKLLNKIWGKNNNKKPQTSDGRAHGVVKIFKNETLPYVIAEVICSGMPHKMTQMMDAELEEHSLWTQAQKTGYLHKRAS